MVLLPKIPRKILFLREISLVNETYITTTIAKIARNPLGVPRSWIEHLAQTPYHATLDTPRLRISISCI
jgi:hypothetical protein